MHRAKSFGKKDAKPFSMTAMLERYNRLNIPIHSSANGLPARPRSAQGNGHASSQHQPEVPSSVITSPQEDSLPIRPQSTVPSSSLTADVRMMQDFDYPSTPYASRPMSSASMAPSRNPGYNFPSYQRTSASSAAVGRFHAIRSPAKSATVAHSSQQNGFDQKNGAHDDRLDSNYEKMDIGGMASSSGSGSTTNGSFSEKISSSFRDSSSGSDNKAATSGYETSSSSSFFRRHLQTQQPATQTPPETKIEAKPSTVIQIESETEPEPDTQNTVTENMDPVSYFRRSSASSRGSTYSSKSRSPTQVNHVDTAMKSLTIAPGSNGLSKPVVMSFGSNEGLQNGYATFAPDGSAVYVSAPLSSQVSEVGTRRPLVLEREMKDAGTETEQHAEQKSYWFGKTHPKVIQAYKKGDILRVHVADTVLDPKHLFLVHDEDLTFDARIKEMSDQMKSREEWQTRLYEPPALDSVVCARCPSRHYEWYRGIVFAQQAGSVSVFFLDIGETAKVWLDDLRAMFKSVIDVPRQTMFVELEGVEAGNTGYYSEEAVALARTGALASKNFKLILTDVRGHDMWGKLYLETASGDVGLPVSELYKQYGISDMKKEDLNKMDN